jgi:hypothetical protein
MPRPPKQRVGHVQLPNIKSAGFFHFGGDKHSPTAALRQALLGRQALDKGLPPGSMEPHLDTGDSLIVLPEGFNYVGGYRWKAGEPDYSIDRALQALSVEFRVAFVAGLMESASPGIRYNSAVLIDGTLRHRLALKEEDDGFFNYACAKYNRPLLHRGVWVIALVCIDAFGFNEHHPKPCQDAVRQFVQGHSPTVLCLPVTTHDYGTADISKRWATLSPTVIANSDNYQPSVIQIGVSTVLCDGLSNKICLAPLPTTS